MINPAVGGVGAALPGQTQASAQAPQPDNPATNPVKTFLDYMKETPAQRYEDEWLAAHHLTAKDLQKMSPQEREKIIRQMEADIKARLTQGVGIAASGPAGGAASGAGGGSS